MVVTAGGQGVGAGCFVAGLALAALLTFFFGERFLDFLAADFLAPFFFGDLFLEADLAFFFFFAIASGSFAVSARFFNVVFPLGAGIRGENFVTNVKRCRIE